eukprot:1154213-Rhodomonas_salina.1
MSPSLPSSLPPFIPPSPGFLALQASLPTPSPPLTGLLPSLTDYNPSSPSEKVPGEGEESEEMLGEGGESCRLRKSRGRQEGGNRETGEGGRERGGGKGSEAREIEREKERARERGETVSMPTLRRMVSSPAPAAARASELSCTSQMVSTFYQHYRHQIGRG